MRGDGGRTGKQGIWIPFCGTARGSLGTNRTRCPPRDVGGAGFPITAPRFTEGRRCLGWTSLRWAHEYDRRSMLTSILPPFSRMQMGNGGGI